MGQRDECILGAGRELGSGFIVHAVRRAPFKQLVPDLSGVESGVPAQ